MGRHMQSQNGILDQSQRTNGKFGPFPSEVYLHGAIWLGRNYVMISEEMAESMEFFRNKVLREITSVSDDKYDLQRCVNRLCLLSGSIVTEAIEISNRYKLRAKDILHGASALKPGDTSGMNLFLRNLPIDSIMERTNLSSNYGAVESRHRSSTAPVASNINSSRISSQPSPMRSASPGSAKIQLRSQSSATSPNKSNLAGGGYMNKMGCR